jgi:hypothetical protein
MKTAKRVFLVVAGVLSVLLAGCFNPITAIPPAAPGAAVPTRQQGDGGPAPFTVDIRLSLGDDAAEAEARFIAGPDEGQLKGIYNFMELAVLDDKAAFFTAAEAGRDANGGMTGKKGAGSWVMGRTYHFLLLMGHRAAEGETPTLLAAGLQSQAIDKSGKVTITMWPLEVDTEFILTAKNRTGVKDGDIRAYLRGAGTWTVRWTLAAGQEGDTMQTLLAAKQVVSAGAAAVFADADLTVKRGAAAVTGAVAGLYAVTAPLGDLAVGDADSVSFNLKYRAFNLPDNASLKEWIIRNGVNDSAQDGNTDFGGPAAWAGGGKNGNGAVNFAVGAEDQDLAAYISLPAAGVTPADSSFAASWYTGVVAWFMKPIEWSKNGVTGECTVYTATATLTAAKGGFDDLDTSPFTHSAGGKITSQTGAGAAADVTIAFPETATTITINSGASPFSNADGEAGSIIDTIRLLAGENSLNFVVLMDAAGAAEQVSLASSTDLGEAGLVLDDTNSPAKLTIEGRGRVIDLTGAASGSPLITVKSGVTLTVKNITLMGLKAGDAGDTADNNAPVILVDGGNFVMGAGAVIRDNTAIASILLSNIHEGGEMNRSPAEGGRGGYGGGFGGNAGFNGGSGYIGYAGSWGGGGGGGAGAGGVLVGDGAFTMYAGAEISGKGGSGGINTGGSPAKPGEGGAAAGGGVPSMGGN